MEHFNSIFRTLCLAALLCITSVNASAYKVCDDNFKPINSTYFKEFMGNEKIVVIDKDNEMKSLTIPEGYAVIILPNVKVTVTGSFSNKGDLYVFGNLFLYGKSGILFSASNESNIYLIAIVR